MAPARRSTPARRSSKSARPSAPASTRSARPAAAAVPRVGRIVTVAPDRFLTGATRLRILDAVEPDPDPGSFGDEVPISIDVVRARDLVAFRLDAYGCELAGGRDPILRERAQGTGRLVYRFTYQHLGEEAQYDTDPDLPVPVRARPSRSSRVVLALGPGDAVPFTSEGLLAALGRLPMLVHPLARPGTAPVDPAAGGRLVFQLPGGLQAVLGDLGVVVRPAPRSERSDPRTAEGLMAQLRGFRMTRAVLATSAGTTERVAAPEPPGEDLVLDLPDRRVVVPSLLAPVGGRGLVVPPLRPPRPFRRPTFSRPPRADETAIEAPYRLVISPDDGGGWAHADSPVEAGDDADRVELWHTRLGRRPVDGDGHVVSGPTDERATPNRIVRAIWARDRERYPDPLKPPTNDLPLAHDDRPFRMSLDGKDRTMLVRQTAETWLGTHAKRPRTDAGRGPQRVAVGARGLARAPRRVGHRGLLRGGPLVDPRLGPHRPARARSVRAGRLPGLPVPVRAQGRAGEAHRAQDEGRVTVGGEAVPAEVHRRRRADEALRRRSTCRSRRCCSTRS